jgi:outer membrane protein TolC
MAVRDRTSRFASARYQEQIAMNRCEAGLVGYLNVVYLGQTLLVNEQFEVRASGQRLVAPVVLVKALGGGWECWSHQ